MHSHRKHFFLLVIILVFSGCSQEPAVIWAHAHNDYEHNHPLQDALKYGFISVEADVHLIAGDLYVSHDTPKRLDPALTLESLYLRPLKNHIDKNKGFVYPGYSGLFYLMIDIKTPSKPTYDKIKQVLAKYVSMLAVVKKGVEQGGPVKILLSGQQGSRPLKEVLKDEPQLAGLDGRPVDLQMNIPNTVMPVVSDDYGHYLSWNGKGKPPAGELQKLERLVKQVHARHKKLRLWGSPDDEKMWAFLLDHGVDLINTDHLKACRTFLLSYHSRKH